MRLGHLLLGVIERGAGLIGLGPGLVGVGLGGMEINQGLIHGFPEPPHF